jgi:hypothetical protein
VSGMTPVQGTGIESKLAFIPKSQLDFEYISDMTDEEQRNRLRDILRSENNSIDMANLHVNFTKDGLCSVLIFFRCYDPEEMNAVKKATSRRSPLER